MNRSPYSESYFMSSETCTMLAMVQGADAAAPIIPPTAFSGTASVGFMLACDNFASGVAGDITRTGVSVYTIKLKEAMPIILDIAPNIWGTDGKWAQMTDYNPTTRVATVKTYAAGGAAADLAATDFLRLTVCGRLSVSN